jgi:hypothetical protein
LDVFFTGFPIHSFLGCFFTGFLDGVLNKLDAWGNINVRILEIDSHKFGCPV